MQIIMTEIDKSLLAFLNGLSKRLIFGETEITDEFLRNEVLGGIPEEGKSCFVLQSMLVPRGATSLLVLPSQFCMSLYLSSRLLLNVSGCREH